MMYELKTKENDNDVLSFIQTIENEQKRGDALKLLEIFTKTTDLPAKMWGEKIIGFGSYHYKYASGHEGDAMLVGFSPQKAKISLYFATGDTERAMLFDSLGKHSSGKACVYINKLSDINVDVLIELIRQSIDFLKATYT